MARDTHPMMAANLALFVGTLCVGGVLFLLAPRQAVSEGEKRALAAFPEVSLSGVVQGKVARGIDAYYADNFVFRDGLTRFAADLRAARGLAVDGIRFYAEPQGRPQAPATPEAPDPPDAPAAPTAEVAPAPVSRPSAANAAPGGGAAQDRVPPIRSESPGPLAEASEAPAQDRPPEARAESVPREPAATGDADTASAPPARAAVTAGGGEAYQSINSVIVYRKRAVQLFGGSERALAGFAAAVNHYRATLGPQVTVYCMAMPIGSDFYLPERVSRGQAREKLAIDALYARLDPEVRPVRAYESLARHVDDYIYFRTDHHWTGRGAYHAYRAFAQAAGFAPVPLEALTRREIPNFLGSLYQLTLDRSLQSNPDSVEYFMVPNRLSGTYYPTGAGKGLPAPVYVEQARGGNAYGVFLGADHALFRIASDVGNGKRILVIKDSYGNALAPYLGAHYEDVFVLDYRYFNGSIPALIREHGISEVLFAHNTFVVNAGYTAARARAMLLGERPPGVRPASAGASP